MKILAVEKLRGQKRNLPTVGITEIPEDGILDLEESLAAALVDSNIGYSYVTKKKKEEKVVEPKTENQETDFEKLTLQDLIELAKDAEFPKEEWEKFSKNTKKAKELMIIYLTKKLK